MGIETYRTSPANNGSVLATGTMVEGMSPGLVNDSMRQIAADLRTFYNDPFFIEFGIGDGTTAYTRVNGTQFTLAANVIDTYHVGRRVKLKDGTATTLYGTITASAFSSPNTTVSVSWDGGASIGSGTITSVKIGLQAINSPAPVNIQTGGVIMWSTATIPDTWLLADGSFVSKTTYSALWNAIGSTYGTPSATQFYLPNLSDKFVVGKGSTYSLGATGGASTLTPSGTVSQPTFSGSSSSISGGTVSLSGNTGSHTLTTSQIPSHSHYLFSDYSHEQNANQDWVRVNNTQWSGGDGYTAGKQKSAAVEGYQAAGSDDFKYRIAYDTNNATPSVHPSSSVGSGSGHTHSLSGNLSLSGATHTPTGTISQPTFSGSSSSIVNPYLALSYIIKT
ncbi:MAG: hypothetical protein CMB64_01560 [Euryarchaeota archaeon]|nr:hypothetical protein [Euryarchaeota archaeon]